MLPFCLKKMNFSMKKSKWRIKFYRLVIWGAGCTISRGGGGGLDYAQYFIKWRGDKGYVQVLVQWVGRDRFLFMNSIHWNCFHFSGNTLSGIQVSKII